MGGGGSVGRVVGSAAGCSALIAAATDLPLSADLENGFVDDPAGVAEARGPGGLGCASARAADVPDPERRRKHSENLPGYAFLSPWLIGLLAITAIPMLLSLYLSFTDYDVLTPLSEANWVGLANYERMFTAQE